MKEEILANINHTINSKIFQSWGQSKRFVDVISYVICYIFTYCNLVHC